ncbi:MAG: outer membrane protein transport protein [Deltaproteobacteria bacterium]|nr:outer membrane protein transport protein [Deltaproteobacteria bacterium]
MKRTFCIAIAMALMLTVTNAYAGGFLLYEHNSSATGMAGARTAISDDPSSMFYNPAAISELEGLQLQIGATGILPYVSYEPATDQTARSFEYLDQNGNLVTKIVNDGQNATSAKLKGFNPIHLYATYNLPDWGVTLGYGLNNPFGLGTYWPGDWDGRFIGTETEIHTFFNNAVVAVDIAKLAGFKDSLKLSLAAGYTFVYGSARLAKRIDLRVVEALSQGQFEDPWGEMRMLGSAIGHGWNVALYAELPELVSFGFSLRSQVSLPFEGTAKFVFIGDNNILARDFLSANLGVTFPTAPTVDNMSEGETTGNVTIDLPMNLNVGLAFLGIKDLKIAADFFLAFFESYGQLDLSFNCVEEGTCSDNLNTVVEKNWSSSWQVSLGAEYMVVEGIPLRVGYGMVSSPVPNDTYDPSLPDAGNGSFRHLFTAGTGYHADWWKLDLGYMLAMWKGTKDNLVGAGDASTPEGMANGTYTTVTHLLGLTFTAAI